MAFKVWDPPAFKGGGAAVPMLTIGVKGRFGFNCAATARFLHGVDYLVVAIDDERQLLGFNIGEGELTPAAIPLRMDGSDKRSRFYTSAALQERLGLRESSTLRFGITPGEEADGVAFYVDLTDRRDGAGRRLIPLATPNEPVITERAQTKVAASQAAESSREEQAETYIRRQLLRGLPTDSDVVATLLGGSRSAASRLMQQITSETVNRNRSAAGLAPVTDVPEQIHPEEGYVESSPEQPKERKGWSAEARQRASQRAKRRWAEGESAAVVE